jgi:hypothetical protein
MKYTIRDVPLIEAMQYPHDDSDELLMEEFVAWAERWHFEYKPDLDYPGGEGIKFRRKQTLDPDDWVHVNRGDYIVPGFDHVIYTEYEFQRRFTPA